MLKTLNYNKINIKKDREYILGLIFTLVPVALFAIILCNRTMPYAEGWYTYYAQLINDGQVVYKDFEYLFMPGYITFIALFTKIFGYSIIVLRLLGVVFFTLISYFAYKIFVELFNPISACFGTVATMFFLQSEVVQIFYDYIRFMDIFAYLAIFLLIRMCKNFSNGKNDNYKIVLFAGFANAMVLMTKQNIGLLFGFYVFCFFVFLFIYIKDKKNVAKNLVSYGIGAGFVFACYGLYLLFNGALGACLQQTLFGATQAKGGVTTILFNWIVEGKDSFVKQLWIPAVFFGFIVINAIINKVFPKATTKQTYKKVMFYIFGILTPIVVLGLYIWQTFSKAMNDAYRSYTYGFYTVIVIVFVFMIVKYVIDFFSKEKKYKEFIPFFMLLGSIFAIGYGVGMSGSLAASQIALSVGFIICLFISMCNSKYDWISMSAIATVSMCFVVFCGSAKLVDTYNWWGLTDSTVWKATEKTNVPLLKGIKVSKEEKIAYEGMKALVDEYTTENDDIFCFPHIPVVYSAVDRKDPGTFTKVQWFDVSTNENVENDISIVEKAQPKVIIIYNIPEFAIEGHEESFNKGTKSATHQMYDELRTYCLNNAYTASESYEINSKCSITVWVKGNDKQWCQSGDGTKESPYVISSTEQFMNFADMVNGGASFSNQYLELTTDIDLSGIDFTPIGSEINGAVFDGTFNGNGYVVKNLTINKGTKNKDKDGNNVNDVALFGTLNGRILNLGLVDSKINGYCVAGLVRHSNDKSSAIINCYIRNCELIGKCRSGAIADDYVGMVYNCIALNVKVDADRMVGMVANRNANINCEHLMSDVRYYHDEADYSSTTDINSNAFSQEMNSYANAYTEIKTTETKTPMTLNKWVISDGVLTLSHNN